MYCSVMKSCSILNSIFSSAIFLQANEQNLHIFLLKRQTNLSTIYSTVIGKTEMLPELELSTQVHGEVVEDRF